MAIVLETVWQILMVMPMEMIMQEKVSTFDFCAAYSFTSMRGQLSIYLANFREWKWKWKLCG